MRIFIPGALITLAVLIGCIGFGWYLAETGFIKIHLEITYENYTEEEGDDVTWPRSGIYQNPERLIKF